MPNPTLILGGPGSGKTEHVVARVAALYQADPFASAVALVPTVRHGDQFRRRLVERCGVAMGLRVDTIGGFSRGMADTWFPSEALVEELLHRTVPSQTETGPGSYFKPISATKGLSSLIRTAVRDLLAEAVDPQALSEAANQSGSASLMALASIYAAYVAELERRAWVHPVQTGLAAARAIRAGGQAPQLVVVDGFHLFRGTELALLEATAYRVEMCVTMDPKASTRSGHDYERLLRLFPKMDVVELYSHLHHVPRQLRLFGETDVVELQGNGTPGAPTIIAGEAADREGQLRAIARQIKQCLTDEPSLRPSDFALAFRQASPHLSLARHVFSEYDLPLDPAAGERLNTRPLGVWMRRLLHLAEDGWRLRDLISVLSSGFADLPQWGLHRGHVAQIARYGREKNLWSGLGALERIVDGLRVESEGEEFSEAQQQLKRQSSEGLKAALLALQEILEQPPSTTAEHARRLEQALFGGNGLVRAASQENRGVAVEMEALRGYLQELASTHETLGGDQEDFPSFRARVEAKLDAPVVLLREAGGVLLAPMHTLQGLRFDFVAVGGLIAGEFPAPRTSAGLLNNAAIAALNQAGLHLPPEGRLTEDELWMSASTRADSTLAVWKTRLDERGRPASASHHYPSEASDRLAEPRLPTPERTSSRRELAISCASGWSSLQRRRPLGEPAWPIVRVAAKVESRRRSFGHANDHEGKLVPGLTPWLTRQDARWSASRLESYRTCAFQFYGGYGLRLQELDQEVEGADAATRGTVIHDVLRDALEPLVASGEPLTPATMDEVSSRLWSSGRGIWNDAPAQYGFGRAALWRLEADQTLEQLATLLRKEAANTEKLGVKHIAGAEKEIVASLPLDPPLQVVAKVDRMDVGDDLVVIVDYKSGRAITEGEVVRGERVQLQLYGYLGREEAAANRVVARYAWLNPKNTDWALDSASEDHAAAIESILTVAGDVRNSVESGDFRVNPQVRCPSYCSMRHICRVNQFSRWKRWD